MSKFRKKPVVIEAWHFERRPMPEPEWLGAAIAAGQVWYQGGEKPYFTIKTLEGEMRAEFNDWIIRGIKDELYPCKPNIFAELYEPA